MTRSDLLPEIFFDDTKITNELELFQNRYLRPILKFQNDHLVFLCRSFLKDFNARFDDLPKLEKEKAIQSLFKKAQSFRQQVIGLIIALLEKEQLAFYALHHSDLNKRMWQMAEKRVKDQLL